MDSVSIYLFGRREGVEHVPFEREAYIISYDLPVSKIRKGDKYVYDPVYEYRRRVATELLQSLGLPITQSVVISTADEEMIKQVLERIKKLYEPVERKPVIAVVPLVKQQFLIFRELAKYKLHEKLEELTNEFEETKKQILDILQRKYSQQIKIKEDLREILKEVQELKAIVKNDEEFIKTVKKLERLARKLEETKERATIGIRASEEELKLFDRIIAEVKECLSVFL